MSTLSFPLFGARNLSIVTSGTDADEDEGEDEDEDEDAEKIFAGEDE
jgi:hypothetical protein